MRLQQPFIRLPLQFDVKRLREELTQLPSVAWAEHPNQIAGNTSVRLISAGGTENDDVDGEMLPTPSLIRMPYVRQILTSFGVVWSRSRLMRLAPGADVPQHADINYHWFNRVRLHIPIITRPEVLFRCDTQVVHMRAGEAWLFDNWRLHSVVNPTPDERIHLVADTSGSAGFWQFVQRSCLAGGGPDTRVDFDPARNPTPLTERTSLPPVMPPAEVDLLTRDLSAELLPAVDSAESRSRCSKYQQMLQSFCQDWRQLYMLHGVGESGRADFSRLRDAVRSASQGLSSGLVMRTNRIAAHMVLEGRVLRPCLSRLVTAPSEMRSPGVTRLSRPVFIIAAPRSGSTLLFETLAASSSVMTVGGEAHMMIEGIAELQPGGPGVESNRLTVEHFREDYRERINRYIVERLQDSSGRPAPAGLGRFLEKTPKNALRIPFLDRLFPDALFVFLWRDPRENLSSIIEAWRSGKWKTYNGLEGFDGPWSLLLPPGWRSMRGRPVHEIAAFQWETTNAIALDDLAQLPATRWLSVNYTEFLADPEATVRRICTFADIEIDAALLARVRNPLPLSKFTQTVPDPEKWRINEAAVLNVLPGVETTWQRLKALRDR